MKATGSDPASKHTPVSGNASRQPTRTDRAPGHDVRLERVSDPATFSEGLTPFRLTNEAAHNLLLGICAGLLSRPACEPKTGLRQRLLPLHRTRKPDFEPHLASRRLPPRQPRPTNRRDDACVSRHPQSSQPLSNRPTTKIQEPSSLSSKRGIIPNPRPPPFSA